MAVQSIEARDSTVNNSAEVTTATSTSTSTQPHRCHAHPRITSSPIGHGREGAAHDGTAMTSSSPSAAPAAAPAAAAAAATTTSSTDGAAPTHDQTSPDMMDIDIDANKPPPQQPSSRGAASETQDSKINDAQPNSTLPTAPPDPTEPKPESSIVDASRIEKDQPTTEDSNQPSANTSIKAEPNEHSPSARPETPNNERPTTQDQSQSEQQNDVPKTPLPSNQATTGSADLGSANPRDKMASRDLGGSHDALGAAAHIVPQANGGLDAGLFNDDLPRPGNQPLYSVGSHVIYAHPENDADIEFGRAYSLNPRPVIPPFATPIHPRAQPMTVTPQQLCPSLSWRAQDTEQSGASNLTPALIDPNNTGKKNYLPCWAQLEFKDGAFAITTYEIVIGRDLAAIKRAAKNEKRAKLLGPTAIAESHVAGNRHYARSYVSEQGGILGPESESGNEASHSQHKSRSAEGDDAMDIDARDEEGQSDRRYIPFPMDDGDVDADEVKTAAGESCFLGIHSPGPDIVKKSKAISRRHLRIYFDKDESNFKVQSIHHNGYFLNDVFYKGGPHVLRVGDRLQIKDVEFTFLIAGVKFGCTGAEDLSSKRATRGGKEMSFDFSSNRPGNMRDTSEELSSPDEKMLEDVEEDMQQQVEKADKKKSKKVSPKKSPKPTSKSPKTSPKVANARSGSPAEKPIPAPTAADATATATAAVATAAATTQPEANGETRISLPQAKPAALEDLPEGIDPSLRDLVPEGFFKKRGPGRPPKNGVMSKRQQRELKKLVEASEKAKAAELPQPEEPIKRKVGRPRKHQLGDDAELPPEKRKAIEGGHETLSGGEEKKVKEKKTKPPRAKSPPLEMVRSNFSEEALQKPSKNYCQMIDEVLTPVGREGVTLKQIYKRIATAYPYFYFIAETKGWESSVRHNLIGNDAFAKDEDRGTWYRRTEISLDAGKKTQKRERSPSLHQGAQIPQGQYYPGNQQPIPHPQNGYMPQQYPQGYPVQNQQMQQMGHPPRPAQYGQASSPHTATTSQHSVAQHPSFAQGHTAAQGHPTAAQTAPYAQPSQQQQPASQFRPTNGAPVTQQPAKNTTRPPAPATGPSPSPQPDTGISNLPEVRVHVEPILVQLLNRTLSHLRVGLADVKCPNPDEIIWSAVDRAIGIRKEFQRDSNFKQMESIAGKGLQDLLDGTIPKYRPNKADGTPAHKTLLHPDVTRHLVAFRDSCINTLKSRFGEEEAVELINNVITDALGFTGRPPPTKDLSRRFYDVLQLNVRSMLNRITSHYRPREHEALLSGDTPRSRSVATPTPVPASVSPAASAGANPVPVSTTSQGSPPMPPAASQTVAKPTLQQSPTATGTSVHVRPQSQQAMSPPAQGPPPQAPPPPASQASATAAAPTPVNHAVPPQPQRQAQEPTQASAIVQTPAQAVARLQAQTAAQRPAPAPATQTTQSQPQQQKPVQPQVPASTTAPSTSTSTSAIQPAMFRPQVPTQAHDQSPSSTAAQPPVTAPAPAPPVAAQEAQAKPQAQTQTPAQEQVSTQKPPSSDAQAVQPAQPEPKAQETQTAQPAASPGTNPPS